MAEKSGGGLPPVLVGLTACFACLSSRFILRQTYTLIPQMASPRARHIAPPPAIPAIAPTLSPSLASPLLPSGGGDVGVAGGGGEDGGSLGIGGGAGGHGGLGGLAANVTGVCHSLSAAVSLNVVTYVENKVAQTSARWLSKGLSQRQIALQTARSFCQPRPMYQQLGPRLPAIRACVFLHGDDVEPHAVHFLLCARRVPGVRLTGRLMEAGTVRALRRTQQNVGCDSAANQRALIEPHTVAVDRIHPQDLEANVVLARCKPLAHGVAGPCSFHVTVHDQFVVLLGTVQGF